ncbi:YHS domain-containing (seleno)protein [Paracoccus methylarcula]|uniref:YHS domain-containing protein n=1 Tax=Paracoccus methylarcula TaxID=72022 RepID=A0A422QST9_9RHOB|nr:YHS domain-containing (seleno)protein [Paracoccus methylarcula]RNF33053.1 hypothetical protein A7A09_018885 [Paracoccus methylarcula]
MKPLFLAVILAAGLGFPAFAGEQFIDPTGFAVSGYDVVAYRDLGQAAPGLPQPAAIPGKAGITAEYNGAVFAFATTENRVRYLENPAYFAPQYDGHCAYGVSRNNKVPGNPNLWRIVDGRLYLNITPKVAAYWERDIPGNIDLAEENWPEIEPDEASTQAIPGFRSPAPLGN